MPFLTSGLCGLLLCATSPQPAAHAVRPAAPHDLTESGFWSWDPAAPVVELPPASALWVELRRRARDCLPHGGDGGLAVTATPTIVTGTLDAVPGLGIDGEF
jgi:hypothetical protein